MQAGKRTMVVLGLAGAVALAIAGNAQGGPAPVNVLVTDEGGDSFDPESVSQTVGGGGLAWNWDLENSDEHNVVQDRKLFRSGRPKVFDDEYRIDPSAGTYPYYCVLHGSPGGSGMSGEVRISPDLRIQFVDDHYEFVLMWATDSADTGDRFDVDYRKGNGAWKHWKRDTKATTGRFGRNDKPAPAQEGKTYRFRVRSQDKDNPKKHSEWSPNVLTVINR